MIQITGLSNRQVRLLDEMWELDTYEDFMQWYNTHDRRTQRLIDVLQQMVVAESMEEDMNEFKEAKEVLSKFALQ